MLSNGSETGNATEDLGNEMMSAADKAEVAREY